MFWMPDSLRYSGEVMSVRSHPCLRHRRARGRLRAAARGLRARDVAVVVLDTVVDVDVLHDRLELLGAVTVLLQREHHRRLRPLRHRRPDALRVEMLEEHL